MEITGAASHGLQAGDVITIPVPLGWWARFLIWINNPWHWPPKTWPGPYVITEITNSNSFEIERDETGNILACMIGADEMQASHIAIDIGNEIVDNIEERQ